MEKKITPEDAGAVSKTTDPSIPQNFTAVNPPENDNLIFFNSTLEHLPAEEYKTVMVAVCHYLVNGIIPPLNGLLKSVFLLATARIRDQQSTPRKRGGQRGNKNARKVKMETKIDEKVECETKIDEKVECETNKNESFCTEESADTAEIYSAIPAQISAQKTPPAQIAVENTDPPKKIAPAQSSAQTTGEIPAQTPPQIPAQNSGAKINSQFKLNLKEINNINYLNLINCENENESETKKRIKTNLKRFGLFLSDKTIANIVGSMPNQIWLTQGCDFPTYLAEYVIGIYKNKNKSPDDIRKLYISALNREKWETPWETYPNWLNQKLEAVLVDRQAVIRTTPPQNYCPDCGQEAKLEGMRCPKCLGYYCWNEKTQTHDYVQYLNLDNFRPELDALKAKTSQTRKQEEGR